MAIVEIEVAVDYSAYGLITLEIDEELLKDKAALDELIKRETDERIDNLELEIDWSTGFGERIISAYCDDELLVGRVALGTNYDLLGNRLHALIEKNMHDIEMSNLPDAVIQEIKNIMKECTP